MGVAERTSPDNLRNGWVATLRSPVMRRLLAMAERVASVDSTVLITGETGVGKERLARWLHDASLRAPREFVAVNCAALPETLLDSELFGHARGAFTGASHDRIGLIETADAGTLFLDEIGDISPATQVKLLRVLQEREIRRIGEAKARPVDIRLIAATHRNLATEVVRERFRVDLFYRLRVIELHVPPLRERSEDLEPLAVELVARISTRLRRPCRPFTVRAFDHMLHYAWPGNIRELEHAIERACVLATGSAIDVEDLPEALRGIDVGSPSADTRPLPDRERAFVRSVLDRHRGRRTTAARELGISVSTLKRRLRPTRTE